MMRIALILLPCCLLISCGGSSSSDTPAAQSSFNNHVVSNGASYTEAQESANSLSTTPEVTGYTLDNTGIVITGTFEASNPSFDYFRFNSGTASHAIVRAFVNGAASNATIKLQCQGYSVTPSVGSASQVTSVAVAPGLVCAVNVYPVVAEAGSTYTIELIATP